MLFFTDSIEETDRIIAATRKLGRSKQHLNDLEDEKR
jgi:hypothetical protein